MQRVGLVFQAMLDGFLLRSRIQPDEMEACRWEQASLFADTVVAFTLGVIDADRSRKSSPITRSHAQKVQVVLTDDLDGTDIPFRQGGTITSTHLARCAVP